ncbi:MAG: alpha-mannosidase [Phycisphaeraceae bacterium]
MEPKTQFKLAQKAGRVATPGQPAFGRYTPYTLERVRLFQDRLAALVYPDRVEPSSMRVAGPTGRIAYAQAQALTYRDAALGDAFGPLWSTYWFKLQFRIPDRWAGRRVDLRWDSNSEALLFLDGRASQGLNPSRPFHMGRYDAMVCQSAPPDTTLNLDIEMACNGLFGVHSPPGKPAEADGHRRAAHWLGACELRLFDPRAWEIAQDYSVLSQLLLAYFPEPAKPGNALTPADSDPTWPGHLLRELNRFCNTFDPDDPTTWDEAAAGLKKLLAATNPTHAHRMSVIGHAHIDTAWLWPVAETHRKCRRTFASVLGYMDRYPEFQFACSQAYQYQAIEELDPELFARIIDKAEAGQWVPVGGSWVEPDCNLPSGESLCRQFFYGQRYFERVFGRRQTVFWNPDVFGYNGQLPQIMQQAGLTRFLTQKLSWNRFTTPMHHTFYWRGIDGTAVLAHFPPADTYNGDCAVTQLRQHARDYKDFDRGAEAYYLFGYGDGGGGPSPTMLETLRRTRDLQGIPRTEYRGPDAFFERLEQCTADIPVQCGELYFELHRGTYTSQARTKQLNAQAERKLHDAEFAVTVAYPHGPGDDTRQAIERAWKRVLLNQFHDILPGSSIAEVYEQANLELREACEIADRISRDAFAHWVGREGAPVPVNTLGVARREVALTPEGEVVEVEADAYSVGSVVPPTETVQVSEVGQGYLLRNKHLAATLSRTGELTSLVCAASGLEHLAGAGNRLVLYDDTPTLWDAWDIDPQALESPRPVESPARVEVVERGPLRVSLSFKRRIGERSTIQQTVRLDALSPYLTIDNEVDWHEKHKLLKAEFTADTTSDHATYESQYGVAVRNTHRNTLADAARFECPGLRWIDLSDAGSGLSVMSDCKYGYAVRDSLMTISLLRSSTYPDPEQDAGRHRFRYAVYPHEGTWREADTPNHARRFCSPVRWARSAKADPATPAWVRADKPQVVIDTIKPAEQGEGFIVRLYESHGAKCAATLTCARPIEHASLSNTLEDTLAQQPHDGRRVPIQLRPFQLMTLRLVVKHER